MQKLLLDIQSVSSFKNWCIKTFQDKEKYKWIIIERRENTHFFQKWNCPIFFEESIFKFYKEALKASNQKRLHPLLPWLNAAIFSPDADYAAQCARGPPSAPCSSPRCPSTLLLGFLALQDKTERQRKKKRDVGMTTTTTVLVLSSTRRPQDAAALQPAVQTPAPGLAACARRLPAAYPRQR